MTTALRLALFIDAQNAYRRARACFYPNTQSGKDGQFYPMALGQLIATRGGPSGATCALEAVRVYSGSPDGRRDPRTYASHRRQTSSWQAAGATVITRPLRYPASWPTEPAQEKGIDVALAIDFVTLDRRSSSSVATTRDASTSQWLLGLLPGGASNCVSQAPPSGVTGWAGRITTQLPT